MNSILGRRFRVFFSQTRAKIGLSMLAVLLFFSMAAEIWSHQNPIVLVRKVDGQTRIFFPSLKKYPVSDFGITDSFTVNFRELVQADQQAGRSTFAIFPVNRWDPYIQTSEVLVGPSANHWLGTDNLGRDVTARLLYGTRVSLMFGFMFWFFSYLIGVTIGALQGYFVGKIDFVAERFKELLEIIPFLSVVILINGLMKSESFMITLFVVVVLSWIGIGSQVRAQFLALRKRDFCEAARALGGTHSRIIFKHILPNALTPVITYTPFAISAGISVIATLDYLGFGLNPPTPSMGELLAQGRDNITNAPWVMAAPTIALATMLISINLLGEALREAFDPRSR